MTTQKNLPSTWDLWLFDNSDIEETNQENFFEKIEKVLSVKTTIDFQSFYSQFQKPKNLPSGSEVFFFKEGIKPLWEDPKNKNGGSFFLHIKKTFSNRIWENILLAIVAQEQPELEKINGVIMRILKLEVVFFLWTQDLSISEQKFMIRWLKETAGLSSKIKLEFKPHPKSKKQINQSSHVFIQLISISYNEPLSDYLYLQKRFRSIRKRIPYRSEAVHFQSQKSSLYNKLWISYLF